MAAVGVATTFAGTAGAMAGNYDRSWNQFDMWNDWCSYGECYDHDDKHDLDLDLDYILKQHVDLDDFFDDDKDYAKHDKDYDNDRGCDWGCDDHKKDYDKGCDYGCDDHKPDAYAAQMRDEMNRHKPPQSGLDVKLGPGGVTVQKPRSRSTATPPTWWSSWRVASPACAASSPDGCATRTRWRRPCAGAR